MGSRAGYLKRARFFDDGNNFLQRLCRALFNGVAHGGGLLWSAALLPVSLLPTVLGLTGKLYFVGALALGAAYFAFSCRFARLRSRPSARQLLLVSVLYLPALLVAQLVDRLVRGGTS